MTKRLFDSAAALAISLLTGCSTTSSNLNPFDLQAQPAAQSTGYVEIENLCDHNANVRMDFLGNAGSKSFDMTPGEVQAVYFGPNSAYVCYTLNMNRPIRACPRFGNPTRAEAYIELCGADGESEASIKAIPSSTKRAGNPAKSKLPTIKE